MRFLVIILILLSSSCVNDSGGSFERVQSGYRESVTHLKRFDKKVNYKIQSRYGSSQKPLANIQIGKKIDRTNSNYRPLNEKINDPEIVYNFSNQNREIEYVDTYYDYNDNLENDSNIEDVIKNDGQYIGHYKIGNSYEIFGIKYQPQEFDHFVEEGMASWYGPKFHGKKTANGEIYNMHDLTAAHRVLPLPSIVKVTNLENNRHIIVRINDRGPFAKDRVIDLSKKAAEILGFKNQGTTKVRVELMQQETKQLLKKLNLK